MMRILLGVWLLQALSAGSMWLALSGGDRSQLILWVALVMGIGMLAALWLWTTFHDQRRLGKVQQSELMANKNAELQADLARRRAEDAANLRAVTDKAVRRPPRLLKAGLAAGCALGLGLALMLIQVATLGLLAIAFVGGGVGGFVLRGQLARVTLPGRGSAGTAIPSAAPEPPTQRRRLPLRLVRMGAA